LNPLAIDTVTQFLQPHRHPTTALLRVVRVLLVDQTHESQVLGRLLTGLVVVARPGQVQQLALPDNTQLRVIDFDQLPLGLNRHQ
jgi:hypothetical protein